MTGGLGLPRFIDDFTPALRYLRVEALTYHVLSLIKERLCNHREVSGRKQARMALFDAFYNPGVEVITDEDRQVAGLPARRAKGLTVQELGILEAKRIEAMLRPLPPFIIEKKVDGK